MELSMVSVDFLKIAPILSDGAYPIYCVATFKFQWFSSGD